MMIPSGFQDDVQQAADADQPGDLSLLADEARSFDWAEPGMQLVADKLRALKHETLARSVLERLRSDRSPQPRAHALDRTLSESVTPAPHVILFSGHRIDAPGRPTPRFPASKEPIARERIKSAVAMRLGEVEETTRRGIAGGGSGGDILFHEVCADLGVATSFYLALPPESFVAASVADGGAEWVRRFYVLNATLEKRVLSKTKELPRWLAGRNDYSIWQRNNLWMLHNAMAVSGNHFTLVALWNGEGGDGPGGTEDMVRQVRGLGAHTIIIDTKKAFDL